VHLQKVEASSKECNLRSLFQ